jgi:hypothetical protein
MNGKIIAEGFLDSMAKQNFDILSKEAGCPLPQ